MCQRFSLAADLPEITERYRIDQVIGPYRPRYNVAPTQYAAVIVEEQRERKLESLRWGLMPYWSRDAVNADGQGIGDRAIYRRMTNKQRCVIPVSGFFGWETKGKARQPIHFVLKGRGTFAVPGFYEVWPRVEGGDIRAYTMLTTLANELVGPYSDRMPAILDDEGIDAWLSESNMEYRGVFNSIRALAPEEMMMYPVGAYVNERERETPECVEPIRNFYSAIRE